MKGQTFRCCPGCATRQGWALERMIRRGLDLLDPQAWVAFLTVTEPAEPRAFEDHSRAVGRFLQDLWRLLDRAAVGAGPRRGSGASTGVPRRPHEYVGVREVQTKRLRDRGEVAWHTHLIVTNWSRIDLRPGSEFRRLLERHGLGTVGGNVQAFRAGDLTAGSGRARYLAKNLGQYLGKSGRTVNGYELHASLLPKHAQLRVKSRGWADGLSFSDLERESVLRWMARHGIVSPAVALRDARVQAVMGADVVSAGDVFVALEVAGLREHLPPGGLPPPLSEQLHLLVLDPLPPVDRTWSR